MSAVFCCRTPRTESPECTKDGHLHTLRPALIENAASTPSVAPQIRDSRSEFHQDDVEALREIFCASSFDRGNQAARASGVKRPDGSLLHAEPQATTRSPKKTAHKRIEAFGQAVKQRLSESGLSKHSSRASINGRTEKHQNDLNDVELRSPSSTGITDLLVSRTASEGGYDSDAKDVRTPPLLVSSSPGSLRMVSLSLSTKTNVQGDEIATALRSSIPPAKRYPDPIDYLDQESVSKTADVIGRPVTASRSPATAVDANSLTPSKTSPTIVLLVGLDKPLPDDLCHGKDDIVDGTPHSSVAPQLGAPHIPVTLEPPPGWRLAFPAPRRSSSLSKNPDEIRGKPKTLGTEVESENRDRPTSTRDSNRPSLMSDIEPRLLECFSQLNATDSLKRTGLERSTVIKVDEEAFRDREIETIRDNCRQSGRPADWNISSNGHPIQGHSRNSIARPSITDADKQAMSLASMRISQRLASTSMMEIASPTRSQTAFSDHGGHKDLTFRSQKLTESARFSGWVAQEHNRKPSDPNTKLIFENKDKKYASHPNLGSLSRTERAGNAQKLIKDDTSSSYMSEAELPLSDEASLSGASPQPTYLHKNSLAVGGRHASSGLPAKYGSIGQLSNAEEAFWLKSGKPHSRQTSEDSSMARQVQERQITTTAAEDQTISNMLGALGDHRKKRHGTTEVHGVLSEVSVPTVLDKRLENMSEIRPNVRANIRRERANAGDTEQDNEGWLSQGRRSGWGYDFIQKTPSRHSSPARRSSLLEKWELGESATGAWERAFRHTRDEQLSQSSTRSFTSTFGLSDWSGRTRRKYRTSKSSQFGPIADTSRSGSPARNMSRSRDSLGESQRVGVEASAALPKLGVSGPPVPGGNADESSQTFSVKQQPNKKSFLALRRFTTPNASYSKSGAATPVRDYFNWTRFPSHTREERCGPAGVRDGVLVQDFVSTSREVQEPNSGIGWAAEKSFSTASLGFQAPRSWRLLAFKGEPKKSKSMTFAKMFTPPSQRLKKRGPIWHLKNQYRSQSSDLRRLRAKHRSSIALGREGEYPELEIPRGLDGNVYGFGGFQTPEFFRPSFDRARITEYTAESSESRKGNEAYERSNCLPDKRPKSASEWSTLYKDCVGETPTSNTKLSTAEQSRGDQSYISASVRSGADGDMDWQGTVTSERRSLEKRVMSTELRDSTIDFRKALMEREEKSRRDLLGKLNTIDTKTEGEDEDLEAPPTL